MTNKDSPLFQFYTAFQQKDAKTMGALYGEDATFEDPAFGKLNIDQVRAMWKMLIKRGGSDLKIEFEVLEETEFVGKVIWQAYYVFSKTKRPVHNIITANFKLANGKIVEHIDQFDFYRWSSQALGLPGRLLGWSPIMKNKVRKLSKKALEQYMRSDT
ncbi:nuclear transport factor 2 family protein [Marinoscillum sp. MHG1-6]|uniref:nuclear transport factor 2 family protein n=1 Tax=Marinoscillum sp. MHG1-6 TaxID=2959627 RepID=UPI00215862B0|nr:nuclear transport factor 2 family protein [Marinoscillum sp. MHG1-6]